MKTSRMGANKRVVPVLCAAVLLMLTQNVGCDSSNDSDSAVVEVPDEPSLADVEPPVDETPPTPTPPTPPPPPPPPPSPTCDATVHGGTAFFFTGPVPGHACGFGTYEATAMVGAISPADFGIAAACGACVEVTTAKGTARVQVVDRCEGCAVGDLDLSEGAYALLGSEAMGTASATWRFVPCETSGPIRYYFAPGANPWWFAVQIRNSANPIATLEVLMPDQTYLAVTRTSYNYFVVETGLGDGPFSFRVRDVYGQELKDTAVPLTPDVEVPGAAAFPACSL